MDRNEKGECRFMGYICQFGKYTVYHSGDTLWYEGLETMLKPYAVDVAFLPINGNNPERKVAGNLNTEEAAQLGRAIGAKLVIPHHFDLFEFNTADPAEFANACEKYEVKYKILEIGEGIHII